MPLYIEMNYCFGARIPSPVLFVYIFLTFIDYFPVVPIENTSAMYVDCHLGSEIEHTIPVSQVVV